MTLARHRADVGAAVTADFGFVTHAAERHAHEVAARRLGDRLAERGLADAGRADEAEDRARSLFVRALHREIFEDALLDLVQAVMVLVRARLARLDILLDLLLLAPRQREQPVEIVAHDRRLRRHRRHLRSFFISASALVLASFDSLVFLMRFSSSPISSRLRRRRPARAGSPSSARSDNTRAASSPSAASRGCGSCAQDLLSMPEF
jgi:hypothetical protein